MSRSSHHLEKYLQRIPTMTMEKTLLQRFDRLEAKLDKILRHWDPFQEDEKETTETIVKSDLEESLDIDFQIDGDVGHLFQSPLHPTLVIGALKALVEQQTIAGYPFFFDVGQRLFVYDNVPNRYKVYSNHGPLIKHMIQTLRSYFIEKIEELSLERRIKVVCNAGSSIFIGDKLLSTADRLETLRTEVLTNSSTSIISGDLIMTNTEGNVIFSPIDDIPTILSVSDCRSMILDLTRLKTIADLAQIAERKFQLSFE